MTVSGSGFTGATTVYFGTSRVTTTISVNAGGTQLTVKSPPGTAGTSVNVRVVTPGGESAAVTADLFTYGPIITSLSRSSGPVGGGTKVTITGAGFIDSAARQVRHNDSRVVHSQVGHPDRRHLPGARRRPGADLGDDGCRDHAGHQL